jgi:hypothetical protein
MDAARKLSDATIPFVPRASSASAATPLQIAMNPFVAGASGSRMGRPLQTAFGEVIRQIGLQAPVVVVVGSSGTGKSLLMDMTARACLGMGLSVRRVERGDQVHTAFGAKSDALLVDQTDSMSNSNLQTLLSSGKNTAATMVFMCLPTSVGRFNFSDARGVTIELTPLALSDSRNYLQERAASIGRPNLFTPEALDLAIDGSRGLPRLLRSIAHLAFLAAASEGATQIGAQHVSNTSETRALGGRAPDDDGHATPQPTESAPPVSAQIAPDPRIPAATAGAEHSGFTVNTIVHKHVTYSTVTPYTDDIRDNDAVSAASRPATAAASTKALALATSPELSRPSQEAATAKPVKEFHRAERETNSWVPRAVAITGGLLASVAAVAAIPLLMKSNPDMLHLPSGAVTVARPVVQAPVQTQRPAAQTAVSVQPAQQAAAPKAAAVPSRVVTVPAVDSTKPIKGAAPQHAAPTISVQAEAKPASAVQAPVAPPAAIQPTRETPVAQETATVKPNEDKAPVPAIAAEQARLANSAAEQAAALKAAEERAAEAKATAIRIQAAERAFLIAQEAGRLAQAAREAAAQEKAKKDAEEQYKATRQNANRQFRSSLLGVGR